MSKIRRTFVLMPESLRAIMQYSAYQYAPQCIMAHGGEHLLT